MSKTQQKMSNGVNQETKICQNCHFETSYAPERPEIVYCEKCYNSEVV